jgi:hypothetical protein
MSPAKTHGSKFDDQLVAFWQLDVHDALIVLKTKVTGLSWSEAFERLNFFMLFPLYLKGWYRIKTVFCF